jgi:hypothetical protein
MLNAAAFYMRTTHSADEVQALYRAGPIDKFESQQLDLLDAQALLSHGSSASPLYVHSHCQPEFSMPLTQSASLLSSSATVSS